MNFLSRTLFLILLSAAVAHGGIAAGRDELQGESPD